MFRFDRRNWEAGLWFLIAPVIFFREAAFGGAFFHSQAWTGSFAARAWWFEQLKSGHFALWSSGLFAGYPLFAESQTAPLYPSTFVLFTLLPPTLAYAWDIILHFAWAGFGVYQLARLLQTRHTSSIFAGTMYAFSGFLITHLSDFNLLAGAAWLPWIVWGTLGALQGRKAPSIILAIGWTALSLAPHPNGTILAAIVMLFTLLAAVAGGGYGMRGYLRAVYATTAGLLAGAFQTLATFSLLRETERSAGVNEAFRSLGSLPPWNILHAALPDLQGTPRLDSWFGGLDWTLYAETCFYFGVSAIPFVCVGLFFLRGRVPLALACGAALSFAVMIGRYGFAWNALAALPLLDATRIPARFALPLVLCLAILAARGLDATVRRRSRASLAVAATVTIVLLSLAIAAQNDWAVPSETLLASVGDGSSLGAEWAARIAQLQGAKSADRLHAVLFGCGGIAILALFTYVRYAVPLRYAPIAILFLDFFLWGRTWNPTIDADLLTKTPPAIEAFEALDHPPRFARQDIDEISTRRPARDRIDPFTPGWDVRDEGHANPSSEYATAAWSLTPNVTLLYGAESACGFTQLLPKSWREWVGLPENAPGIPRPRYTELMLDLLSVDAVLSSRTGAPLPGGLFLTRNRNPMPRARLSVRWRTESHRPILLTTLHANGHEPRAMTLVDRVPGLSNAASFKGRPYPGAADRPLALTLTGPNSRTVDVDRPGLVVLAETYDAGWQVEDPTGRMLSTLQADGLFLAFPADMNGTYELRYRPAWVRKGLVLSGSGLIMLGLLIVFPARPPSAPRHEPATDKDAALAGAVPHPPRFETASLVPVGIALAIVLAAGAVMKQGHWRDGWHARSLVSTAASSWSEKGYAAYQTGAYGPALQALEQSIRIDRRNSLTHYRAGLVHETAGRPGPAMRAFENALSIDPGFEPALLKINP